MTGGQAGPLVLVALILAVLLYGGLAARRPELARLWVEGDELVAAPVGVLKLLALAVAVRVPLEHVVAISRVDRPQDRYRPGVRMPGTWLPGLLAGSFQGQEGRSFWVVGRGETSLRIDLQGARLSYLVVDVADPVATMRRLNQGRHPE